MNSYIFSKPLLKYPQMAILLSWLILILMWLSNFIHYKVRDKITFPFPNVNHASV